jgi:hypothetical protein
MAIMKTTEQRKTACVTVDGDARAQICTLLAEVADLRGQLHDQARVIADLQAAHQKACCPRHARSWHRDHTR